MTKQERKDLILRGTDWNSLPIATINRLSAATISRLSAATINCLSAAAINCLKETRELAKWPKPYTNLLKAVKRPGCSLDMSTWHTCETTHCAAAWTVTLAPGGKKLEEKFGTQLAARIILQTNRPESPLPNFYASDDAAMAFIEARAEEERESLTKEGM